MFRRPAPRAISITNDYIRARRSPTSIRVREAHVERLNKSSEMEYEILHVLEFNRCDLLSAVVYACNLFQLSDDGADARSFYSLSCLVSLCFEDELVFLNCVIIIGGF